MIGAGKLYDIPLRKLAERFEQLLLVDIDAAALAESVQLGRLGAEPARTYHAGAGRRHGRHDVFLEKARAAWR